MKNKIRLVHIISNLSLGGAQILLLDILKYLKKKNDFDIKVITIDSGEFIQSYMDNGIEVIDLKEKGLVNLNILFKLKKFLKELKPDIVHTHLNKADFYGRIAAKKAKIQNIFSTCHNYSSHHKGADLEKISIFDRIDNAVIKYSDSYIVAISKVVENYIIKRDNKFADRVELIYNGIDVSKEKYVTDIGKRKELRNTLKINEDDFVILISGRLEKQKGQTFFIESLIDDFNKKKNIKLLILGDGNMKEEIEEMITEYDLGKYIFIMGFQKSTEEFIEISDLIAVPSLWEGFGLVILEAMIKYKPVLATNTGGIPEIIQDGYNGFLFEKENKKDLQYKFNSIYENINNMDELKKNAMNTVLEKFNIDRNSEKYRQLYYRFLNLNYKKINE